MYHLYLIFSRKNQIFKNLIKLTIKIRDKNTRIRNMKSLLKTFDLAIFFYSKLKQYFRLIILII